MRKLGPIEFSLELKLKLRTVNGAAKMCLEDARRFLDLKYTSSEESGVIFYELHDRRLGDLGHLILRELEDSMVLEMRGSNALEEKKKFLHLRIDSDEQWKVGREKKIYRLSIGKHLLLDMERDGLLVIEQQRWQPRSADGTVKRLDRLLNQIKETALGLPERPGAYYSSWSNLRLSHRPAFSDWLQQCGVVNTDEKIFEFNQIPSRLLGASKAIAERRRSVLKLHAQGCSKAEIMRDLNFDDEVIKKDLLLLRDKGFIHRA